MKHAGGSAQRRSTEAVCLASFDGQTGSGDSPLEFTTSKPVKEGVEASSVSPFVRLLPVHDRIKIPFARDVIRVVVQLRAGVENHPLRQEQMNPRQRDQ